MGYIGGNIGIMENKTETTIMGKRQVAGLLGLGMLTGYKRVEGSYSFGNDDGVGSSYSLSDLWWCWVE